MSMARGGHVAKPAMIHSAVPGRTDRLPMSVPIHSHVIPADVVSGYGQGNSMAGDRIIREVLKHHSSRNLSRFGPHIMGKPTRQRNIFKKRADGGDAGDTNIVAAGGEMVIDPDTVLSIGNGDYEKGHKILDDFIVKSRKRFARDMLKLPGPKK